jgi:hypothetical protein
MNKNEKSSTCFFLKLLPIKILQKFCTYSKEVKEQKREPTPPSSCQFYPTASSSKLTPQDRICNYDTTFLRFWQHSHTGAQLAPATTKAESGVWCFQRQKLSYSKQRITVKDGKTSISLDGSVFVRCVRTMAASQGCPSLS